jgi:microcin C transport system substrate-binding protein
MDEQMTLRVALTCCALLAIAANAREIEYSHGFSYIEPLKYGPDFEHFEYVNPDAPKGGLVRFTETGTYDSFNGILHIGRAEGRAYRLGETMVLYDRLMEDAMDEPASRYGRLASGVWVADDYRQFAFKIREGAYWHDGEPLTAADVVFTFEMMREHGAAGVKSALYELDTIKQISEDEVLFTTKPGAASNPDLLFVIGGYSILPKHFWEREENDITKVAITPPLGSGPYRIGDYDLGRNVTYERVENYWGKDIPVNKGRYNFDRIKFDYIRDESVQLEALKGDVIDIRQETTSKNWAVAYDIPAVEAGFLKKEMVDLSRPWGLWAPLHWNMDRKKFQDRRVREALFLLSDWAWINRVLMHNVYNYATSYFYNSKMASSGLPSEKELELLEPMRDLVPPRVFTHEYKGNLNDGYGYDRDDFKRALELLREAGWEQRDGVMTNVETGEPFTIDLIFNSPFALRQETPFMAKLNLIGIKTTARQLEVSNWLFRMRNSTFDGTVRGFDPNNVPGIYLRNQLGSASADSEGGQNWANIRDPAIDALIEHVMAARNAEDFYAAVHALDRVLLWNFYYIPSLASPGYRLVYWDRFGRPEHNLRLLVRHWLDTWWYDEDKAERLRVEMAKLTGK